MAKTKQKSVAAIKSKRLKHEQSHLHFAMTAKNYTIIGVGIAVIIVGYILMNANSVDGFMPTVVAPILLVLGYCFVIPYGILFNDKSGEESAETTVEQVREETNKATGSVSSNVKTG